MWKDLKRKYMLCKSFTEAYTKAQTMVVIERGRALSRLAMSRRLGESELRLTNFEKFKSIDVQLLDMYMQELDVSFTARVEVNE